VSRGPYRKPYRIFYFMVAKVYYSEDSKDRLTVIWNIENLVTIINESDNQFNDCVFCFESPEEAIEFANDIMDVANDIIRFYKLKDEYGTEEQK